MTLYQAMTMAIESYTQDVTEFEKDGHRCEGVRGMIDGMEQARKYLTVESSEMESA
jgi:hypothetical protein